MAKVRNLEEAREYVRSIMKDTEKAPHVPKITNSPWINFLISIAWNEAHNSLDSEGQSFIAYWDKVKEMNKQEVVVWEKEHGPLPSPDNI